MATPKERDNQRKRERQREFDPQVRAGTLVVRQMTPEERVRYAESPHAADERRARRTRKSHLNRSGRPLRVYRRARPIARVISPEQTASCGPHASGVA